MSIFPRFDPPERAKLPNGETVMEPYQLCTSETQTNLRIALVFCFLVIEGLPAVRSLCTPLDLLLPIKLTNALFALSLYITPVKQIMIKISAMAMPQDSHECLLISITLQKDMLDRVSALISIL